jgi:hypothetical protein
LAAGGGLVPHHLFRDRLCLGHYRRIPDAAGCSIRMDPHPGCVADNVDLAHRRDRGAFRRAFAGLSCGAQGDVCGHTDYGGRSDYGGPCRVVPHDGRRPYPDWAWQRRLDRSSRFAGHIELVWRQPRRRARFGVFRNVAGRVGDGAGGEPSDRDRRLEMGLFVGSDTAARAGSPPGAADRAQSSLGRNGTIRSGAGRPLARIGARLCAAARFG